MSARFLSRLLMTGALALAPLGAYAGVSITEIMYDAPGADTGHEWIEVENTGGSGIDLHAWRLAEGGANHKILAQRSPVLAPGAYAVIANDAKKFSADYPSYAGALFQSSFSLSNTGENFALKDASSTETAAAAYTASLGANGDGNTLNLISGAWMPRKPSPGASASAAASAATPAAAALSQKTAGKTQGNSVSGRSVGKKKSAASASSTDAQNSALAASADAGGAVATGNPAFGILPWIFGLLAVIIAGAGAIFMMPKRKPEDEYSIIEDNS